MVRVYGDCDGDSQSSRLSCSNREDPKGGLVKGGSLIRHSVIVMNNG